MAAKLRSPNYPALSLDEAIIRLIPVFEAENRHLADREVVAKDLGYGGVNGASMGVISALIKFGLLEMVERRLRVTERGMNLILHERGDPERIAAVQDAAFAPALFADLRSEYGDQLPSDNNIRAYLIKKGFNPRSVADVIRPYRDTMEFLEAEIKTQRVEPMSIPAQEDVGTPILRKATPEEAPSGFVLSFKLSPEAAVQSTFTGQVTQDAIRKFIQHLELSIDVFPKASPQPVAASSDNDGGL
ncbi:MAG: hypothetical protein ACKVVP_03085 [Chloroflexota bacterium]